MITINTATKVVKTYQKYDLIFYPDTILKKPTEFFDFNNPPIDPIFLASSMFHTMFENKGMGLSANQIGFSLSIFTVGLENNNKQIFFNPKIVETSNEMEEHIEGCLSFPRLFLKVERPKWVVMSWQHVDGKSNERRYEGLTARIILHEMDHILGTDYTKLVGKTQLMIAKDKQQKQLKKENKIRKSNI